MLPVHFFYHKLKTSTFEINRLFVLIHQRRHFIHSHPLFVFLINPPALEDTYSFSLPVGSGSGTTFLLEGEERITAVRLWERDGSYIYGSVSPSPDTFV